jgi:hypothetical protein
MKKLIIKLMGCKFSTVIEEKDELRMPTIEYKSKFENIMQKMKKIKLRAQQNKDTKTLKDAEW